MQPENGVTLYFAIEGSLKMSEQQRFETIRQWVRDWGNKNRAALAQQGGQFEERDGVDEYDAAFYTVYCIMPHCVAQIVVTMPAFRPFQFISMEALDYETESDVFSWHDGYRATSDDAIQTALQQLQAILFATKEAA